MNMNSAAFAAVISLAAVVPAQAITIDFGGAIPDAAFMNPVADAKTGAVFENVIGSVGGVRRSPWQGSPSVNENDAGSFYTSVSRNSSATYNFGSEQNSVSFVWGSPDSYNDLVISLISSAGVTIINGTQVQGPVAIGQVFVTISDVVFDSLVFKSGQNAFEFANLSTTAVPLPAPFAFLLAALAGLGFVSRRRNAAV